MIKSDCLFRPSHRPPRRLLAVRLALGLALGFSLPAMAHDFWLTGERAGPTSAPVLRLWSGDAMKAEEERVYESGRSQTLRLYLGPQAQALGAPGRDGGKPFYKLPVSAPASVLVALERPAVVLALAPERFDAYLAEEHLHDILALRKQGAGAGAERYTRYLKLLVGTADAGPASPRQIGQRLEIVLDELPQAPAADARLRARILFDGAALAGRTVTALSAGTGSGLDGAQWAQTAVTDAQGRVAFDYASAGTWMLRLVHMRTCEGCGEATWESFWAATVIQPDWLAPGRAP